MFSAVYFLLREDHVNRLGSILCAAKNADKIDASLKIDVYSMLRALTAYFVVPLHTLTHTHTHETYSKTIYFVININGNNFKIIDNPKDLLGICEIPVII